MKPYKQPGNSSTIAKYSIYRDAIDLQLADGSIQTYTVESAGKNNVERMKLLAEAGEGLGTFLSGTVKVASARTTPGST